MVIEAGEDKTLSIVYCGNDAFQPLCLLIIDVVVDVGNVESHKEPVIVLKREVAGLLSEVRQRILEVRVAARIHLVVRVDRPVDGTFPVRPQIQKSLLYLTLGS